MMTSKLSLLIGGLILGLVLVVKLPADEGRSQSSEPVNFVFFIADDISWDDLGCYGHPTLKTPNIDRLAEGGLRFTNAYLTISSCSPSRCSIITGRYPHNTGAPELHTSLPEGHVLFPEVLKEAGYHTVLSGKHHMGDAADAAFSYISKGKGPGKEGDWVSLVQERPKDRPFFFWFASSDAHRDWSLNDEAPEYDPKDVIVPPFLVDGEKTREDLKGYYHEVSRFDHFVGEVAKELEREGELERTMMVIMADNGRPFPRCKTRLYDSGIKTPFIVHFPDEVAPGVTDSLVSSIDVSATMLDVAGLAVPERIQGISFAPIFEDPGAVTREVVFSEHNWHVYRNHERLVRMGDWLYIRNNFPDQQNLCVEAYKGGAGEELWEGEAAGTLTDAQGNVFWNPCPEEELYHVGRDADQLNNVVGNPEFGPVMEEMRGLLAEWTEETGDTVPENPTPHRDAPPGQPEKSKKGFKNREMPGEAAGAVKINAKGPVRLPEKES
jgi:N-sulfoglucosamine sulfohydrolase